jgi:hypothetical protein
MGHGTLLVSQHFKCSWHGIPANQGVIAGVILTFSFVVSHPCARKKAQGWGTGLCWLVSILNAPGMEYLPIKE